MEKTKRRTPLLFLYIIIIVSRLLVCLDESPIDNMALIYNFSAILYIGIIFLMVVIRSRVDGFNKKAVIINITFISYIFLFCFIFTNSLLKPQISAHARSIVIYLLVVICTAFYVHETNCFTKFVKYSYFSLAFVLLYCYIQNFDSLSILNYINNIFSRDDRYRVAYGFYHANATGNICLCALMISFVLLALLKLKIDSQLYYSNSKLLKNITVKLIYVLDTIIVIMLLSSGSRSSISGFAIFVLLNFYFKIDKLAFIKYKGLARLFKNICILAIVISLVSVNDLPSFDSILKLSNRSENFTVNFPTLINSGKLWTGLGYVEAGLFGSGLGSYNTFYVDNFYLYTLLTSGIIGLVMMIFIIVYIAVRIIKSQQMELHLKKMIFAMFIVYLYTGLFETCIIYPTFVSSFLYMSNFLYFVYGTNKVTSINNY